MKRMRFAVLTVLISGCQGCSSPGAKPSTEPDAAKVTPTGTCTFVESGHGPTGTTPIRVDVVAKGLEVPWGIAFLPGGDMLVTERPGRVVIVKPSGEVSAPVAKPAVTDSGEAGLLGIALHPDFAQNRQLYLYLTGKRGDEEENRVERWVLSEDRTSATLDRVILANIPSAKFHDGGRIRFGPDGMLYVGTGDAHERDLPRDASSPAGKILRISPEGEVPADNPFPGKPAFIKGIRNTQGFDWMDDGTVVVTDHGPSGEIPGWRGHDEVTVAKGGQDLGWPEVRGCDPLEGSVSPSLTWETAAPPGGAAIYRGTSIPAWKGALLVGTLRSEHLHLVRFDEADRSRVAAHEVYLGGKESRGRLRDVVMGPDGHLYVTTSNCDGRGTCGPDKDVILRITGP